MLNSDLEDYIEAHISPEPDLLHQLDRESHLKMVHGRMCSGHWQGRFLKMITALIRPRRVLELGTFTGYATLAIAEGMVENGDTDSPELRLDTVESYDENEDFIRRVFRRSPLNRFINLHIDHAIEFMQKSDSEIYDMIYIDADKREYPRYLAESLRILRPGGYIIADNTLWNGQVIDPGRHDAQTEGIRTFNRLVKENPALEKVIIPLRDGLTLIRKQHSAPERYNGN